MIRFQAHDPGLIRIAERIARNNFPKLPDTLYVFGANENREALIYLSPEISDAKRVAEFLTAQIGGDIFVEAIGNPPQRQWIAFHRRLREAAPDVCCRVCLFVERAIHNLILW